MLVGLRTSDPKTRDEATDHNDGVALLRSLQAYVAQQRLASKRFFRRVVRDPRVAKLLDEAIDVGRKAQQEPPGQRVAFDRMRLLRSPGFAKAEAIKLQDLLPDYGPRPFAS